MDAKDKPTKVNEIYDYMLRHETVLYYDHILINNKFDKLNFKDIQNYFWHGGKPACISPDLEEYFSNEKDGKERVKHVFSVYLLGIYCYYNIPKIKEAFDELIEGKIWKGIGESAKGDKSLRLQNDFLYLWYLTALYHDMGYIYESKRDNDNSLYSFIVERKNMMSKENLGYLPAVLGIPKDIYWTAKKYFWNRRNNIFFNEDLCTDHGFAGGYQLYKALEKLHRENGEENESKTPVSSGGLSYGMDIFNWYNVPSAWAIICHNIWLAEGGTGRAVKYEKLTAVR